MKKLIKNTSPKFNLSLDVYTDGVSIYTDAPIGSGFASTGIKLPSDAKIGAEVSASGVLCKFSAVENYRVW